MDEDILKGKTLLVVDDEVDLRDIVASELEYMGARVFQAENIAKAQKILLENNIDLIVSDIRMPGGTGIDLLDIVKSKGAGSPPVILITGFADITVEDAFNKGAEALLNKPFKLDDLIKMVVRYTLPFSERFKETAKPVKTIEPADNNQPVFGRGGLTLKVSTHGVRFDIGELVKFDLNYKDQQFEGAGTLRWAKPTDHSNNQMMMGLEFMNLDGESLALFQKMNADKNIVPYIPSAH